MFTRFSAALALVAATKAQWLDLKTMGYGDSTNVAGQCQGGFSAADGTSEGTWFVGVASISGEEGGQWLVGWGRDLCAADKVDTADWSSDYTISLVDSDGTVYTTGLGLTCPKPEDKDKQLVEGLKAQIKDPKATKALGDLKSIVYDGSVIYVDAVIAQQGDLASSAGTLKSDLETNGTTAVNDIVSTTDALIDTLYTELTVTYKDTYDTAKEDTATALNTATETTCSTKLDSESWTANGDATKAEMDEVTVQFKAEMDNIFTAMKGSLETLTTTSKTDVSAIGTSLLESFGSNVADMDALISGEFLDQKTVEKDVVRSGKKAQVLLDNSLAKIQRGTAKVGKDFRKQTKLAINAAIPEAETGVNDKIDTVTTTVETTFEGDKALKACTKSLAKQAKSVKKVAKKQGAALTKLSATTAKTMNATVRTAVKEQKTAGKEANKALDTAAKGIYTEIKSVFPVIDDATFDYAALVAAGKTLKVQVTRTLDSAVQECDVVAASTNAEVETAGVTCDYTAFDEMFFDYLCTMTPLKVAGTELDCSIDLNRPSSSCMGTWKQVDKAIKDAEKAVADAAAAAEAAVADVTDAINALV